MKREEKKTLVIGDLILDIDHRSRSLGKSISDGATPVGVSTATKYMWGGAGCLVKNVLALGGRVSLVSLLGKDMFADRVNDFSHPYLKKIFFVNAARPTTAKERFWMEDKKIFTLYHFSHDPLSAALNRKILATIRRELRSVSKVIVADYRHGILSPQLAGQIVRLCAAAHVPLYIDSQVGYSEGNHEWYRGAYLFCLNQREAKAVDAKFDPARLESSLTRLQKILRAKNIVVKLGKDGSAALLGESYVRAPAYRIAAIDATGAGDAFLGALTLGRDPMGAVDLRRANIWAALSTTALGTEVASVKDFKKILKRQRIF